MHGEESTTQEPQRADRDYDEPIIPGTSDGQWIKEPQFCTSIAARESASPGAALEVGAEYRPGPRHPESGGRNNMPSGSPVHWRQRINDIGVGHSLHVSFLRWSGRDRPLYILLHY